MTQTFERQKNLIWAAARNYDIFFPEDLSSYELKYFELVNFSYLLSQDKDELIFDYMNYLKDLDKNASFLDLFKLAVISYAKNPMEKSLPSYKFHEKEHYEKEKIFFKKAKRNDLALELRYSFMMRYFNQVPKTIVKVRKLADQLRAFNKYSSIDDFLDAFDDFIKENFHFNQSLKDKEKGMPSFKKSARKKTKKKQTADIDDDYEFIGSAEFTKKLDVDKIERKDERVIFAALTSDESPEGKHLIAQNLFGKNILSAKEKTKLEEEISYGNHEKSKIIISTGHYLDNLEASFRQSQLQESLDDNLYFLRRYQHQLKRAEKQIELELKALFKKDLDPILTSSKSGQLISSKVYRGLYLNDDHIFQKKKHLETNQVSIDILIDGSASQLNRKSRIASWTYTISQALSNLNLPLRIMTFSNLEHYLGLTIYRDYMENSSKNKDILNYTPAGSNRDGLVFRLMMQLLKTNSYPKKIFIYLTDGKPFDVRPEVNLNKSQERKYKDDFAEKDTAIEFRKLEAAGIHPLVIFTGEEEDLASMRKIYGSHFAYIKDYARFAPILTQYIKQVLI